MRLRSNKMSNLEKMKKDGNKNHYMFARTIEDLSTSQGRYSRLFNAVNNLSEDGYTTLFNQIKDTNFRDPVDVILWLEC